MTIEKEDAVYWLIEKIRDQEQRLQGLRSELRSGELCDDAVDVADQLICEVESAIDEMLERVEYANTQIA